MTWMAGFDIYLTNAGWAKITVVQNNVEMVFWTG
jgi:hypothetical protein